jgi:hypothetical protein
VRFVLPDSGSAAPRKLMNTSIPKASSIPPVSTMDESDPVVNLMNVEIQTRGLSGISANELAVSLDLTKSVVTSGLENLLKSRLIMKVI